MEATMNTQTDEYEQSKDHEENEYDFPNDPDYDEEEYPSEEVEADNYFYGIEEGYDLAKTDPEKVDKLIAQMSPYCNTYDAGIKAGKDRYDREVAEQRMQELKQVRYRGKTKELTRSR